MHSEGSPREKGAVGWFGRVCFFTLIVPFTLHSRLRNTPRSLASRQPHTMRLATASLLLTALSAAAGAGVAPTHAPHAEPVRAPPPTATAKPPPASIPASAAAVAVVGAPKPALTRPPGDAGRRGGPRAPSPSPADGDFPRRPPPPPSDSPFYPFYCFFFPHQCGSTPPPPPRPTPQPTVTPQPTPAPSATPPPTTPPPTTPPATTPPPPPPPPSDATTILSLHNAARAKHSAPALAWDTAAASSAASWVAKCNFQHSGSSKYGENLCLG